MKKYNRLLKKGSKYFWKIAGMRQQVFNKLLGIMSSALKKKHGKGGYNPVSIEYILLITLWNIGQNIVHTQQLAQILALMKNNNVCRWVKWREDVLMGSGQGGPITLPGKKRYSAAIMK